MFEIIGLTIKILLILFFLGYGFSALFTPKKLWDGVFWFSPWFGVILIAVLGVAFNLGKVAMVHSKYAILLLSGILCFAAIYKKKIPTVFSKESFVIFFLTAVIFIFNIFPLVSRAGFATTISKSNLDPITYTHTGDYLIAHTIFDGKEFEHYKPYKWAVGDLVHSSFRWGSPLVLSFFANVLSVKSYQIYSILLTLFFAFSFPLVYFLAKQLMGLKEFSLYLLLLIFATYGMNSTLLYMLYNVFFAQFMFVGIYILLLIFIHRYITYLKDKKLYRFPIESGMTIILPIVLGLSSLTSIYSEGFIFVFAPFLLYSMWEYVLHKKTNVLISFIKIFLLMILINPVNFGTTIRQVLGVFVSSTKTAWIGWEKIPYAAPLEVTGLYNLYYSKDLSFILDIVLGIPIVAVWIYGFSKIKNKLFIGANIFLFVLFFTMYRFVFPNYYTYQKAITYSLFLFAVLFSVGIYEAIARRRFLLSLLVIIVLLFSFRSAYRTVYQLYWHPYIVDRELLSLRELNNNKNIQEPFYTSDVFLGEYDLWKRLWREYVLTDKLIVTRQNYPTEKKNLEGIRWVLSEKNYTEREGKKLIYKTIVWDNAYYQLGEIEPVPIAKDLLQY